MCTRVRMRQTPYILSGELEATVGGEVFVLKAGVIA